MRFDRPTLAQMTLRYGFVAAFFALSALPLAGLLTPFSIFVPVQENRTLAPRPRLSRPPDFTALSQAADRWFVDHFGLRSFLIRLKTQIDFSLFRTSDRVHIGSDGWLFYRSVMDREKPMVYDMLRKIEPDVLAGITAFKESLNSRGIRLVIAPNLLADRFLQDKLPGTVPHLRSPPQFDHFLAGLRELPGIVYVDTPKILAQAQRERPIFHRTDFHWNDPAAFAVARDLVDIIGRLEGRSEPVWRHALEIETQKLSGGIAMFMPVFFPPSETALFVKRNWSTAPGYRVAMNDGGFETSVHVDPPKPTLLPSTVVLGDSYFDGIIRSGFDSYFNAMYRLRWNYNTKISDLATLLPPDTRYVIIQFIEVNITTLKAFADRDDIARACEIIRARQPAPQQARN